MAKDPFAKLVGDPFAEADGLFDTPSDLGPPPDSPVWCKVEEVELVGDYTTVAGVMVTCGRCLDTAESYGTGPRSIRRCLVLLRERCDESNWYKAEGDKD